MPANKPISIDPTIFPGSGTNPDGTIAQGTGNSAGARNDGVTNTDSTFKASNPGTLNISQNTPSAADALSAQFSTFGDFTPAFGPGFKTTVDYIKAYLSDHSRPDTPPVPPNPWEMSIGACKFIVPPVNIQVSRSFQTGSLTGGAIRQVTPPKFNSGHSETIIGITLYFPNQESIWGYDGDSLTINFDKDPDAVVDRYLSSLRGLVTAFRYTPILPITNEYLNSTFNISAVAMKTLTISTESDGGSSMPFPFCISVNLELLSFDHTAYLPMVSNLQDAVDWGKYRQYMGRCAYIMEQAANKKFATIAMMGTYKNPNLIPKSNPNENFGVGDPNNPNYDPTLSGINTVPFSVSGDLRDSTNIQFYYPPEDPAPLVNDFLTTADFLPSNVVTDPNSTNSKKWWDSLTGGLGLSQGDYGAWSQIANLVHDPNISSQFTIMENFLKLNRDVANNYGPAQRDKWIAEQTRGLTGAALANKTTLAGQQWLVFVFHKYQTDPTLQSIFDLQAFIRGQRLIDEWEVPMVQLPIDPKSTIVTSVTTQTVNNFARLQLNMRDQPTYQHIGGLGTNVEVNLYIKGEADLLNIRLMYDTIANLSRLEHKHAVLGFLGLKNVIIALAGTKYVIPSSFNVQTINGMPHTYTVKMVFSDFDIFQQKREMLSATQQQQLVEEFGKANPFLRIKQNWSAFNAYPDFPLSVIANQDETNGGFTVKAGNVMGQLDPDFYFKSFATIDDDLTNLPDHSKNTTAPKGAGQYAMVHHFGTYSDNKDHFSIGLNDGYWDLRTNNDVHVGGMTYNEPHLGNTHSAPLVKGLTPASTYSMPHFHTKADGSQSTTGLVDANFKLMMKDNKYREQSGRMVRAFPTYMLWLINEGGLFAGQQLFDNFYGLQSVLDFSLVDNEDVMGTTLMIRVSNLYSRLSTAYSQQLDPNLFPGIATIINNQFNTQQNLALGETNATINLATVNIQPGVRLHMRCGYGSNPNLLETIFNGVVTQVEAGDVLTIIAQSDAIELGAVVNNTNTSGSSGDLDGSFSSGLWFSEPRDLMVRLMSMGGSTMKEAIALATAGMLYSENRFGIRHFGRVLYDSMTPTETANQAAREGYLSSNGKKFAQQASSVAQSLVNPNLAKTLENTVADLVGPVTGGIIKSANNSGSSTASNLTSLLNDLWVNFSAAKDTEIFKRNIYPGNGTGIGQYTGGDLGDGGTSTAFLPTGIQADGSISAVSSDGTIRDNSGQSTGLSLPDTTQILNQSAAIKGQLPANTQAGTKGSGSTLLSDIGSVFTLGLSNTLTSGGFMSQLLSVTGITNPGGSIDEGAFANTGIISQYTGPFAEVSFRASTYMKSVWDLFLVCASLLPNYIVAVRPFEDRSTVFYGKPHWAYTSGVLPVTMGRSQGTKGQAPSDTALINKINQITKAASDPQNSAPTVYERLTAISTTEWNKIMAGGTSSSSPTATASASTQPTPAAAAPAPTFSVTPDLNATVTANATKNTQSMKIPPDGKFTFAQVEQLWTSNGGDPVWAPTMAGIAFAESSGDSKILNDNPSTGDYSVGLFQINYYANLRASRTAAYGTPEALRADPNLQALAAIKILGNGKGISAWKGDKVGNYVQNGQPLSLATVQGLMAQYHLGDATGASSLPTTGGETVLNTADINNAPPWLSDVPAGVNPETFSAEQGALQLASGANIPVNFGTLNPGQPDEQKDVLGIAASTLYKGFRSESIANEIWQDFRLFFRDSENSGTLFGPAISNREYFTTQYPQKADQYDTIRKNFQEFMWTNAYHRGWIVLTADAIANNGGIADDLAQLITHPFDIVNNLASLGKQVIGDVAGAAKGLWDSIFGGGNDTGPVAPTQYWDFPRASDLFDIYITKGNKAAIDWMQSNARAGYSQTDPFSRLVEQTVSYVGNAVETAASHIATIVGDIATVATSVIDTLRVTLNALSGGANLALYAGGQANLLNGVYNDSLYYAEGSPGTLTWLCDNVFTREFGEPVVEIREPFQRLHYLNSFQHIIANGIVENSDQVATTVTATSDGAHPVTTTFDKGAPAERQVEVTVDDGLQWQQASSWLTALVHPVLDIRSFLTHFNNGDNATNGQRCARWNLKENLKNIYMGELVILGDTQIRTHDLVYLYDYNEKMFGMFEVEQVVHQFSPDTGFITSITPNAIVIINDPAKWQFGSLMMRQGAAQAIRNGVRQSLGQQLGGQTLTNNTSQTTINDYANNLGDALLGTVQYTGGIGAVVKDFGGMAGMDGVGKHPNAAGTAVSAAASVGDTLVNTGAAGFLANKVGHDSLSNIAQTVLSWPIYSWFRDNLFDAHACYIQYLNRSGAPMDAGLSYNFGSAVGQAHVLSFMQGVLNIPVSIGGETQVSTSDLLTNIGWQSKDVIGGLNSIDSFKNYSYEQVLKLSGQNSVPIGTPAIVNVVSITSVVDATTFTISSPIHGSTQVRLAFIKPPPISAAGLLNDPKLDLDIQAADYLQQIIATIQNGFGNTHVALRIDPTRVHDPLDSNVLLATVFYHVPANTPPQDRDNILTNYASSNPSIQWNDYLADGHPYTLNQEMLNKGYATLDAGAFGS